MFIGRLISKGQPLDTKKQIYALSFALYGFSEYFKASNDEEAKQIAIRLYYDIVKHSYDVESGGYVEALTRDWQVIEDLRLSAKDANEKKSMNTHLHVLEAFSNFYSIWPEPNLKEAILELVNIFLKKIISKKNSHLVLFFDQEWNERSEIISYGHDIEAAWLIQEAAEKLGDADLLYRVKNSSIELAKAASRGVDADGGLWYEYEIEKRHLIKEKHSWPQAEAMIGFLNAWENTGDEKFLNRSSKKLAIH